MKSSKAYSRIDKKLANSIQMNQPKQREREREAKQSPLMAMIRPVQTPPKEPSLWEIMITGSNRLNQHNPG